MEQQGINKAYGRDGCLNQHAAGGQHGNLTRGRGTLALHCLRARAPSWELGPMLATCGVLLLAPAPAMGLVDTSLFHVREVGAHQRQMLPAAHLYTLHPFVLPCRERPSSTQPKRRTCHGCCGAPRARSCGGISASWTCTRATPQALVVCVRAQLGVRDAPLQPRHVLLVDGFVDGGPRQRKGVEGGGGCW